MKSIISMDKFKGINEIEKKITNFKFKIHCVTER
jgi:hypothetical protein